MCIENIQYAAIFGLVTMIVGLLLWWLSKVLFPKVDKNKVSYHAFMLFVLGFSLSIGFHYYNKHS